LKNKLFSNGRIHASKSEDADYSNGYLALTVSPYDNNFLKEVEPGVARHLQILIKKGYLPISSCEGHYFKRTHMNWYIMLAFGGDEHNEIKQRIDNFIDKCKDVRGINFEVRRQVNNTNEADSKVVKMYDVQQEFSYMNELFLKKYLRYQYLYIGLYKNANDSIIENIKRKLFLEKSKAELIDIFVWDLEDERFN